MKTTNQTQTSSTSPRSKRRGFIHLALLCLLSVFMAPIQSFAQQVPTVNPGNGNLPELTEFKLLSTARQIRTRWTALQADPIQVKNGGTVTLMGQLEYEKIVHNWVGLPNKNCVLRVGNLSSMRVKGNANGEVKKTIKIYDPEVAAGRFPRGKKVTFRFEFGGDTVFGRSWGTRTFILVP
jgi:hypothetical protein